ncbi:MAG: ribosome-recycling factor [Patescibacteria group bacterium]|nr:MAG: ribosome-recycling factor [Patescibacteria group bacterium]
MLDESQVRSKMQQIFDLVASDIASIRVGRATPSLVEDLSVLVYGGQQKMKVQELATIYVIDPQTLEIDPWDKSIIGEIRKGIIAAGVGLNPIIAGEKIRISIPPLTTEDRENYLKLLSAKLESGRVMIRQIRAGFLKDIQKWFEEKQISEDEKYADEKRLQEITDEFIEKINNQGEKKKEELTQL